MRDKLKSEQYRQKKEQQYIGLWDLLTILSGAASLGGSLFTAELAKGAGRIYFFIALLGGLLIGVACIFLIRIVGRKLFKYSNADKGPLPRHLAIGGMAIYWLAFIWIVVSAFFGHQGTKLFIEYCLR